MSGLFESTRGPSGRAPSPANDREVHLAEAGRLLREWTASRRTTWSDAEPASSSPSPLPPAVVPPDDTPIVPIAARIDADASDARPRSTPIEDDEETIAPAFNFSAFPIRVVETPSWRDRVRDGLGAAWSAARQGGATARRAGGLALHAGTVTLRASRIAAPALRWLARVITIAIRQSVALVARVPPPLAIRWALRTVVLVSCVLIVGVVGVIGREYWLVWKNSPGLGTAVLDSDLPGAFVSVDGNELGMAPLTTALSVGRHVVQFARNDEIRQLEIDVVEGQSTIARLEWKRGRGADRPRAGAEAAEGRSVVRAAGVAAEAAPAAVAAAAAAFGSLQVESAIAVEVTDANGGRLEAEQLARMATGSHNLRFENRALGWSETRQVEVKPGERTTLTLAPVPSALTVTATAPAEILIDGQRVGEAPLTDHPVALGPHEIVVRSLDGEERQIPLMITTAPARVDIDFATR